MITAAMMPQIQCGSTFASSQQSLNLYTSSGSTQNSATTGPSLCSTPATMLSPNFHPLLQYVQPPSYPFNQPTITPNAPLIQPLTNVFEGVPIFLVPQNGLNQGTVSLAALQRAGEVKLNWPPQCQTSKVDTSKHFHVFVGDLAPDVDSNALRNAFSPYGEISEAKVIRDAQTMKTKGYGFVSFPLKKDAEKAIEGMNKQMLGRRQIRTNWATRKACGSEDGSVKELSYEEIFNATHMDNTSVYVGNVSPSITEEELRQAFAPIGIINEVRIFKQQGYAFVRYGTKDAATRAILKMNGKEIKGQAIRCSWGRTPNENNTTAAQALTTLNLLGTNIIGVSPLFSPQVWAQNQCFSQFYPQSNHQPWQA